MAAAKDSSLQGRQHLLCGHVRALHRGWLSLPDPSVQTMTVASALAPPGA